MILGGLPIQFGSIELVELKWHGVANHTKRYQHKNACSTLEKVHYFVMEPVACTQDIQKDENALHWVPQSCWQTKKAEIMFCVDVVKHFI